MNDIERLGLVAVIIKLLGDAGSWTGRTHIQKFGYFSQKLLKFVEDYEFILYQRGPYSFQLDDDIRSLRSMGAIDIVSIPPYGPTYKITPFGDSLINGTTVDADLSERLTELSKVLGPKKARELELLGTTLYAIKEGLKNQSEVVARVLELKPHFVQHEAEQSYAEVRQIAREPS